MQNSGEGHCAGDSFDAAGVEALKKANWGAEELAEELNSFKGSVAHICSYP